MFNAYRQTLRGRMAKQEAVIEIGSTGIRLLVAEIKGDSSWKILDHAELPVSLGWDVFTERVVSRESLLQAITVLQKFKEILQTWNIDYQKTKVIATSALREAKNRDVVIDRLQVKTGFSISVIDGIEENRLVYLAVLNCLNNNFPQLNKENSVILDIGGGSTEIMMLKHGKMVAAHSLHFGTVIIEQQNKTVMGSEKDSLRFLEEYIRNTGVNLNYELNLEQVENFISLGYEVQLLAEHFGEKITASCRSLSREKFNELVDTIQHYSPEENALRFKIPYMEARTLHRGLLAYKLFLNLTKAKKIIVPKTTIREGMLISELSENKQNLQEDFFKQVIASAYNLGKKYHYDEKHADFVRKTSLFIFDKLKDELALDSHPRLLLELSAILHDIGTFIKGSQHHLHSQYIIANSDIFGLNKEDTQIVSLVAKYHRKSGPSATDREFRSLPPAERMIVSKLSAILRIADALDRAHTQRCSNFSLEIAGDALLIKTQNIQDTLLEKIALEEKGDLFKTIFGYKVVLL